MPFVSKPGCSEPQFLTKFRSILTHDILEFDVFEVAPNALIGIEIGRIGRQLFQMEPFSRAFRQKVFHCLTAVDGGAIPDNQ